MSENLLQLFDYYPFGMVMPGRKFSAASAYRYGFNGKENDNEVKGQGNQQDYGMRIYDQGLGRFLSVDPITKNYPSLTPYQFAGNSPVKCIDLDGLEGDPVAEFNVWLGNEWDKWKSWASWKQALNNVDKTVNPIRIGVDHISKITTGKDWDGNPVDFRGRVGAIGDAGVDFMGYATGGRLFKIAGSYGMNPFEAEMNNAATNLAKTKFNISQNKPAIQSTNSEVLIKDFNSPGNCVVLGKDFTGKLATQAAEVGGFHFGNWSKPFGVEGQTFTNKFFGILNQLTKSGGKIFLDLAKVDVDLAKKGVGSFAEAAEKKLATEWELNQILNNKDFLKNTIFHENGKVLTSQQLAQKGITQ